jgi:putative NADPH-quinone reductase
MNNLIIVAHPDKNSFCYSGIMNTIKEELEKNREGAYVSPDERLNN